MALLGGDYSLLNNPTADSLGLFTLPGGDYSLLTGKLFLVYFWKRFPPTCSSQGLQGQPVMSFPLGMMPSDEGGSETESLYEIEGMNKWILFL